MIGDAGDSGSPGVSGDPALRDPGSGPAEGAIGGGGDGANAGDRGGAAAPTVPLPTAPGLTDVAPAPEAPAPPLADSFFTIWLQPRVTLRRIVARDPGYMVVPIVALAGIPQLLAAMPQAAEGRPLGTVLLIGLLCGPLFGFLGLYVAAWLAHAAGHRLLHGRATQRELRTAIAWSEVPHVLALPLWLLATPVFGAALYTGTRGDLFQSPLYVLFVAANALLQVWGLVIASHGVAEVQGYASAWKGFWNLVLGALLLAAGLAAFTLAAILVTAIVMRIAG